MEISWTVAAVLIVTVICVMILLIVFLATISINKDTK